LKFYRFFFKKVSPTTTIESSLVPVVSTGSKKHFLSNSA
jgi:hypothetical protein